ncbi:hypothetical protein T266_09200 [Pseudomonas aeruginosa VRFPA05]|nr:hypothetical protein T266_09200 [Pseudomonas aeruginosa VRFPA05]
MPAFEALDFLDLRRGYEPLLDWLERAIESIRAGYRCLPFEQEEQVFSVRLPDPAPAPAPGGRPADARRRRRTGGG